MIGLIDKETLNKALNAQKSSKKKLGQILVDMGVADDVVIAKALAVRLKIPYGRIDKVNIPDDIISLIPPNLPKSTRSYHYARTATGSWWPWPTRWISMQSRISVFYTQLPIDRAVAPLGDVLTAIEKHYPKPDLGMNLGLEFGAGGDDIEVIQRKKERETPIRELQDLGDLPPIVKFVNSVISDAIKLKASDISHRTPGKISGCSVPHRRHHAGNHKSG